MTKQPTCEICGDPATVWVWDAEAWDSEKYGIRYYKPIKPLHLFCNAHARESKTYEMGWDGSSLGATQT